MLVCLMSREGNGTPLQYSCLANPMDWRAWKAAVHGVAEGGTGLSDFTFTFQFHALEKKMATQSSVLAQRIPGTGEPGGLPSMGSHRVGHDWSNLAAVVLNVPEVSEIALISFHSFLFILLSFSYFKHSIFQLAYTFFCPSHSTFGFL